MPWILCRMQIPYDWKHCFVCGFHWKSPFSQLTWEEYMIVFEHGPASYTLHSLFRSWHSALCDTGIPWSICGLNVQLDPCLQDALDGWRPSVLWTWAVWCWKQNLLNPFSFTSDQWNDFSTCFRIKLIDYFSLSYQTEFSCPLSNPTSLAPWNDTDMCPWLENRVLIQQPSTVLVLGAGREQSVLL